jgi:pre-mRNA-processing factor 8
MNMQMRVNNVWVSNDDTAAGGVAYIMPKNLLKKFVCIADLKVQVFGYIYGTLVDGVVNEIKSIVLVPQVGSRDGVMIPNQMPDSHFLKGLQIVGWIHTCP